MGCLELKPLIADGAFSHFVAPSWAALSRKIDDL